MLKKSAKGFLILDCNNPYKFCKYEKAMAKLKTILLESILAGSLIFGSPLAYSQNKKAEYVAQINYCDIKVREKGKYETLQDVQKFVSEKLKGYDATIKPFKDSENITEYQILINTYDRVPKEALKKKIEDLVHQGFDLFTKKDFDDFQEIKKAYKDAVIAFYVEGNFDSFKKSLSDRVVDLNNTEKNGKVSFDDIRRVMQALKKRTNLKSYEIISDFYLNAAKCAEISDVFKNPKAYVPKEGDYFADGMLYVKVNGKKANLEMPLIFRKISGQWKIIAFD